MWEELIHVISSVQPHSCLWLFVTPWTAAHQASLSLTIAQSCSNSSPLSWRRHPNILILCHPLLLLPSIFLGIRSFPMSQLFASDGQSIGVSASSSALPMNIQGWFPLQLTGLISLQSKRFSRVFSSTTVWKHKFCIAQPSLWPMLYCTTKAHDSICVLAR